MEMKWTQEQEQVIHLHNRNLLVSAAAGSGKTAVLVERIIQMVTDPEHPLDIDRLLVVTFTNAAAAEMRERVGAAIEKALQSDPDNVHLQRQSTLLHNAQISTIHRFGLSVIRNHFYEIDLDPGFRIGDEREIRMLREDVLREVMEDAYEEGRERFLHLIRTYGNVKNDMNICQMILSMADYAQSYPWPKKWLEDCVVLYRCTTMEEMDRQPWMQEFCHWLSDMIHGLQQQTERMRQIVLEDDGPSEYMEAVESDLTQLEYLAGSSGYGQWQQRIGQMSFSALSRKKQVCDPEKKEKVKTLRDEVKKHLNGIKKDYFSYSQEEQLEMIMEERPIMEELVYLTEQFLERFAEAKADRNMIDFSDIEHFALRILVDEETGKSTAAAKEYREKFAEVMVDEYQDSNYVQEAILTAVSGQEEGKNNLFMVGDVKQSIYRFRLARPELFMEKYDSYTNTDSDCQKIDLHMNFRSRPQVLEFTNEIFYHIMDRDMGNIRYDAAAALYPGASYVESQEEIDTGRFTPEIFRITEDAADSADKVETEARVTAAKIREMVQKDGFAYKDMVILVHALKGWSETFVKVFSQEGIPLVTSSKSGYFSAVEVQTMIQMLKVLNNPRQDIPLAGVMGSVFGNFTPEDLALIRTMYPEQSFYEAVSAFVAVCGNAKIIEKTSSEQELQNVEEGSETERIKIQEKIAKSKKLQDLQKKTADFWKMLQGFRQQIPDTPVHEIIQHIYRDTGYLDYVSALPGGDRRRANLEMFLELSASYEQTSYQGLFDFIRYIEQMLKYELDYGEAELVSEQENAVRLMTIHKSKGLEFPVVFLCGMGKEFNLMSLKDPLIFHPLYGAGLRWMDVQNHQKRTCLPRQIFGLLEKRELLGEELRLLYVALTRAREKLVLTGMTDAKTLYGGQQIKPEEKLSLSERINGKCFFDWVMPVVLGADMKCRISLIDQDAYQHMHQDVEKQEFLKKQELLLELAKTDPAAIEQMEEQMHWEYPYPKSRMRKQKVSVSEIKRQYQKMQEDDADKLLKEETESVPYVPAFLQEEEEVSGGALFGTAMHRFLACMDFVKLQGIFRKEHTEATIRTFVAEQIRELTDTGRLPSEMAGRLSRTGLCRFLESGTAKEMAAAAADGELFREKPFMMSVPAAQVWEDAGDKEQVLVQGIVDVFWIRDGKLSLLDYKTDRVSDPGELLSRYDIQLKLYAEALARVFDCCEISQILIYSFQFQNTIVVEGDKKE